MNNEIIFKILKIIEILLYPFIYIIFCIYIININDYNHIHISILILMFSVPSIVFLLWLCSQENFNIKKYLLIFFYTMVVFVTIKDEVYNKLNSYEYESIHSEILSNELVKNTKNYKIFLKDKNNNDRKKLHKYITIKEFNGRKVKVIGNEDLRSIPENKYIQIVAMRILLSKDFEDISKKIDEINQDSFISINEYESFKTYYIEKKINKDGLDFFGEK